jgi:SAM-dependent methyltransferase
VDTLVTLYRRHGKDHLKRVLELAAGPGDHALELARRGLDVTALDLNPSMCRRTEERARSEGLPVHVVCADMADFAVQGRFELALLMLDSAAHLLDLDSLVSMLTTTARHIEPSGVFILEMSHPADFLTDAPRADTDWEMQRGDLTVHMRWGSDSDSFDPITQVRRTKVQIEGRRGGGDPTVRNHLVSLRSWTATEVDAAVRLSGRWEVAARYGDLAPDQVFDTSPASWRMVHVLRRIVSVVDTIVTVPPAAATA